MEKEANNNNKEYQLGICLSGGGARGIAHIGVLKALEEHCIFPEVVSGASAGSIVGTLYAAGVSVDKIYKLFEESSLFKAIKIGLPTGGLTDLSYLKEQLSQHINEDSFEHLKKPLFISVTNLNTGKNELISSGKLFDIVMASCSIPMVFKPVKINNQLYVDGGLLNNMPVQSVSEKCKMVIGVNVMPHVQVQSKEVDGYVDLAYRCADLVIWNNTKEQAQGCDFYIEPKDLMDYHVMNFGKTKEIFDIGYKAALEKIPDILQRLL